MAPLVRGALLGRPELIGEYGNAVAFCNDRLLVVAPPLFKLAFELVEHQTTLTNRRELVLQLSQCAPLTICVPYKYPNNTVK